MGSSFYTFQEAANRLGCSKRSIHNYVKKGYLRKVQHNDNIVLMRDDVEQLAVSTGVDMPAFNRKNFYMLLSRVQKLEEDMGLCRKILEIRDSPLRPSKEEGIQLQAAASKALAVHHWTEPEIEMWASVFERFDEVSLQMLSEGLTQSHPYEVFFKLCIEQMKRVSTEPNFQTNLEAQLIHKRLDEGRKRMRATILMWLQIGHGVVPTAVVEKLESEKAALFKRVANSKGRASSA